jgi:ribosome-associated protein
MKKNDLKRQLSEAITACQEKQAEAITVLELEQGSGAFTDYFVVCSGTNPRQVQAISDEVQERLEKAGQRPTHVEGYKQAEWVLLDYVDFVVHVFSEKARGAGKTETGGGARRCKEARLRTWPRISRIN